VTLHLKLKMLEPAAQPGADQNAETATKRARATPAATTEAAAE
jgi:hypothetical protein